MINVTKLMQITNTSHQV